jgi:hypothetical protein
MPKGVLDDMKTVCPARYVQKGSAKFVPRLPKANRQVNTKSKKLGWYWRQKLPDDRCLRVYEPSYPLPSATTTASDPLLGSPGGLVRNPMGDYRVSPLEVARAHSFTPDALRQVEQLTNTAEQWKWVANSTPRMTVQALLKSILKSLQCPRQLGIQDAGPDFTDSDVAECITAATKGVEHEAATGAEIATAVKRLVDVMPTRDELAALQAADPECMKLLQWIKTGRPKSAVAELPHQWRKYARYLTKMEGVLFFRPVLNPHGDLIEVPVLPSSLRLGVLKAMHYDPLMCHPSDKALYALSRKRYFWPGLGSDCKLVVNQCGHCSRAKATKRMGIGMTKPMLYAKPFQRQSIDLVGPLSKTKGGDKWILSMIDAFTNYVTFVALPNKEATTVADAVHKHMLCVHGCPEILLSDRGSEFTAGTFEKLMEDYNIDHRVTSPYSPTTNGQCERAHRRLNAILKICVNLWGKEWDQCLAQAAFSYNVTPLTDFPYSPYFMLHLFHPNLPADLKLLQGKEPKTAAKFPRISDYVGEAKELQKQVHQTVMFAKLEEATNRKLKADHHQREVQYKHDDMVTVWRPVTSSGTSISARSSKLLYRNIGPFKVLEPIARSSAGTSNEDPLTYRLQHVATGKEGTYSVRHMFPFMRGTRHSEVGAALQEEWAPIIHDSDLGQVLRQVEEVQPQMLLWLKPRAGTLGHLCEVVSVDHRSDLLTVQLYNTTTPKRSTKWQKVWYDDHPDSKKRQPRPFSKGEEWHEYWTPVHNKRNASYKPWVVAGAFEDFVPIVLDLTQDSTGYLNLPKKFHDKYILGMRPAKQPPLPKEEHRDLSWFVDATTGHPPAETTGKVKKPKTPPQEGVGDRPKRSTRNTAPSYHITEYDDENVDLFEDSTRIALVKAIRALPALFAGAGDALVEFTAQIQDSSSFSAGKCKGQTTVANWHATLARRKANRM